MHDLIIYHNPRCSNSRGALTILQEHGLSPQVIEYLTTPPDASQLATLVRNYEGVPLDFVRLKEPAAAALNLSVNSSREAIVDAIVAEPVLLQRPVVVLNGRVIIARPPEILRSLLDDSGGSVDAGG